MPALFTRLANARERQILSHAKPSLEPGEAVEAWVRTRHPESRGSGFIYLTSRRCVVYWSRIGSEPISIALKDIRSWGVDRSSEKGPVLGIESGNASEFVQLIVGTEAMVDKVNFYLDHFAQYAPRPRGPLEASSHPSDYEAGEGMKVDKQKKSFQAHTRRVVWTVLGVTVLAVGIVLLFAPGPGILVVLLGLSLLAREYDWAQDILHWARDRYYRAAERFKERRSA